MHARSFASHIRVVQLKLLKKRCLGVACLGDRVERKRRQWSLDPGSRPCFAPVLRSQLAVVSGMWPEKSKGPAFLRGLCLAFS